MPPPDPTTLAAMMTRRLCHDLSGPLGALLGGCELLEDNEITQSMLESARKGSSLLRFFRLAVGATGESGNFQLETARAATEEIFAHSPLEMEWEIPPRTVPLGDHRIILNLVLTLMACAPRHGKLTLTHKPEGMEFSLEGVGVNMTQSMRTLLTAPETPEPPLDSRQAPAYYAGLLARLGGNKILTRTETKLVQVRLTRVRASPPQEA